jgi:hypothetical protein
MRSVLLAIVGLAFAMGFASGDSKSKKQELAKQNLITKQLLVDKEKHPRRW